MARWLIPLALLVLAGAVYWGIKRAGESRGSREAFPDSAETAAYLTGLREELAKRGIKLAIIAYPRRHHLEEPGKAPVSGKERRHHEESVHARQTLERIRRTGIEVIDLWEVFRDESEKSGIWQEDGIHLKALGARTIADRLRKLLVEQNYLNPQDGASAGSQVLMGDCWALGMGKLLNEAASGAAGIRILKCNGDRGRVANLLFLFPDDYLHGSFRVFWAMSYRTLATPGFAPLVPNPVFADIDERSIQVEVIAGIGIDRVRLKRIFQKLSYANALCEIPCRVVSGDREIPTGTRVILTTYAAKNRTREGITQVRRGDLLNARVVDMNSWLKDNPKVAKEFYFTRSKNFETPRFWVLAWTYTKILKPSERKPMESVAGGS